MNISQHTITGSLSVRDFPSLRCRRGYLDVTARVRLIRRSVWTSDDVFTILSGLHLTAFY